MVISLLVLAFTSIAASTWHERQVVASAHIEGATDLSRAAVTTILDSCVKAERRALLLSDIRDRIEAIPFVRDASVYFSDVRGLTAEVRERTPVAHVVLSDGSLRYVDAEGIILPSTKDHVTECLPLIRGIQDPLTMKGEVKRLVVILNSARQELDPSLYEEVSELVKMSDGTVRVVTDRLVWRLGDADNDRAAQAFANLNTFWKVVSTTTMLARVAELDLRWAGSVVVRMSI
jgi:cell division septal protein FtsQ